MNYKTLLLTLTLLLGFLLLHETLIAGINSQAAWAAEKHQVSSGEHGEGHGGGHHSQGMPLNYLLSWALTVAGLALGIAAFRIAPKKGGHEDHADGKRNMLASSIIYLMLLTFLVDMFPPHGYHESFFIGFIRLGIKLACGILFLYFGLAYHYAHEHLDSHH